MNREARRRGDPLPYDNRRDTSLGHSGSPDGRGSASWERSGGSGGGRRTEYDYSDLRTRSRSRSPEDQRGRDRRSRSRSVSSGSRSRGSGSRSHLSRGSGHSGSRRSRRSDEQESRRRGGNGSRGGSGSRGERDRSGSGMRRSGGSGGHRDSRESRKRSYRESSTSSSSSSHEDKDKKSKVDESAFSKDQRTVFVSQLVMRATEKDIRRYFKRKVGCKVNEVILLRDKRTGNHKGCAYVQMGRIEDVNKAVSVAGQPPDFQRFPILVKASEAEKNYVIPASSSVVTASMMGTSRNTAPLFSKDGKVIESQKVYVGGLDPSVSEEHIFALFSQFGHLEKVSMQMDPATRLSRGYAFLSFRDPKDANLAIQTMSNQVLAGRPLKTGWASQTSTIPGVDVVTSEEFPDDASTRAQKAFAVLAQLTGSTETAVANATISSTAEQAIDAAMGVQDIPLPSASAVPTVAEARATLTGQNTETKASGEQGDSKPKSTLIGGIENPTKAILVHNMFDKDTESGESWAKEIEEEFREECSKFGKLASVKVMADEPGGKIFASFEDVESAVKCANNLAGRWFDKRQLRVDFKNDSDIPH